MVRKITYEFEDGYMLNLFIMYGTDEEFHWEILYKNDLTVTYRFLTDSAEEGVGPFNSFKEAFYNFSLFYPDLTLRVKVGPIWEN